MKILDPIPHHQTMPARCRFARSGSTGCRSDRNDTRRRAALSERTSMNIRLSLILLETRIPGLHLHTNSVALSSFKLFRWAPKSEVNNVINIECKNGRCGSSKVVDFDTSWKHIMQLSISGCWLMAMFGLSCTATDPQRLKCRKSPIRTYPSLV